MSASEDNTEYSEIISEFPQLPNVLEKVSNLPAKPGIYQYKNAEGKIIYVGKAKNLRNRVRSYFQKNRPRDAKTQALISKIADLEVMLVDSEAEALILEDTLIKRHKPRYNVLLRDDKSYPYIRVTNEPFPRLFVTRKVIRDGSKYYGPYTEVGQLKALIRTIRTIFMLRSCDLIITDESIEKQKHRVCLDYHIHKCEGPCVGLVSKEAYNENIKSAIQILLGKTRAIEAQLKEKMEKYAEEMKFEAAGVIKRRLDILREYMSKQKIVTSEPVDRDIFALTRDGDLACSIILKVRDGKLIGKRHYIIKNALEQTDESIMQRTIERWYLESDFVPGEIFLCCEPDQLEYLTDYLGKKRNKSISISVPQIGEKKKMIEMATSNAEYILKEFIAATENAEKTIPRSVLSLQRDLNLKTQPRRIECIDNSHIQGSDYVSSVVVFEDGKPKKSDYRKFKMRTVKGNDDFAAMQEVVRRRYSRLIAEGGQLPDLIIIDGGKGQLSSAVEILDELGLMQKVAVIGLAKRLEEVFFPGMSDSILLPRTSSSLRLIQQLRDEAHRFAITFHRLLREKRTLQTELTQIAGVGKKSAEKLLTELGSVENVRQAELDVLKKYLNQKQAQTVYDYFHDKGGSVEL
ncbi:MAG: excinuclease ABC subunit UvrC [Chloroflexota bacterium]